MKKTIAFVLVLVIILGLAACGTSKEAKEFKISVRTWFASSLRQIRPA